MMMGGPRTTRTTRTTSTSRTIKSEAPEIEAHDVEAMGLYKEEQEESHAQEPENREPPEATAVRRRPVAPARRTKKLKGSPPKPLAPDSSWKRRLARTAKGNVSATPANAVTILKHDPAWLNVLAYDSFVGRILKLKAPKWHKHDKPSKEFRRAGPWTDTDTALLRNWFEREYDGMLLRMADVAIAVDTVSKATTKNGPKDYLKALVGEWDRTPRVDKWLVKYGGARNTPYVREVSKNWMISAVARVFEPGCQVDHTIVLEGLQGLGKSSLLRTLCPNPAWFLVDIGSEFGKLDSFQKLKGKWLNEMSELDSLGRSMLSSIKAFMTNPVDTYRKSYGRETEDHPRTCVFAGTTNKDQYLTDDTGNRRFWPVILRRVDIGGLKADRDQLWAEAVTRYLSGELWHITDSTLLAAASAEQASRLHGDPWERIILEKLRFEASHRVGVTTHELLCGTLKLRAKDIKKEHEMRVASILRGLKWTTEGTPRKVIGGVKIRRYFPGLGAAKPAWTTLQGGKTVVDLMQFRESKTLVETAQKSEK
jgi:putative DNA primase/helicase